LLLEDIPLKCPGRGPAYSCPPMLNKYTASTSGYSRHKPNPYFCRLKIYKDLVKLNFHFGRTEILNRSVRVVFLPAAGVVKGVNYKLHCYRRFNVDKIIKRPVLAQQNSITRGLS
jgi:hypothetical protein